MDRRLSLAAAILAATTTTPSFAQEMPSPPAFYPAPFTLLGDAFDCADFASQAEAQAVLRADAIDPNPLDANRNGIACENNRLPRDMVPVARS